MDLRKGWKKTYRRSCWRGTASGVTERKGSGGAGLVDSGRMGFGAQGDEHDSAGAVGGNAVDGGKTKESDGAESLESGATDDFCGREHRRKE
jgi:hypothetical protein